MTSTNISRRQLLHLTGRAILGWCVLEPWLFEPYWFKINRLSFGSSEATHRLVQITDIHYRGNRFYLEKIVEAINSLLPDFVCFSGDLVEKAAYLNEALDILSSIKCPVYGVPGNHDYSSRASFNTISQYCESTGGKWLLDQDAITKDRGLQIVGATGNQLQLPPLKLKLKRLLIVHYPLFVNQARTFLKKGSFNLVLAGHSHGGQVRIPFWGALILPDRVGPYDLGAFQTEIGPLYVNPGIGTFFVSVRAWCRPEISLIEL